MDCEQKRSNARKPHMVWSCTKRQVDDLRMTVETMSIIVDIMKLGYAYEEAKWRHERSREIARCSVNIGKVEEGLW